MSETITYTRQSDTELLIQFVEDQGFDKIDLVEAAERLKQCYDKKLQDYIIIE